MPGNWPATTSLLHLSEFFPLHEGAEIQKHRPNSWETLRWRSQARAGQPRPDEASWDGAAQQRFRFALPVRCTALPIVAVASARQGRFALLTRRLPTAVASLTLERCSGRSLLQANRHTSMPTHDTRSQVARKVNFAIQLLRETAELLVSSPKTTPTRRSRYPRRSIERDE